MESRQHRRARRRRASPRAWLFLAVAALAVLGGYVAGSAMVRRLAESTPGTVAGSGGGSTNSATGEPAASSGGAGREDGTGTAPGLALPAQELTLYYIQVGAFRDSNNAGRLAGQLHEAGFPAAVLADGNRVVVAYVSERATAEAIAATLPPGTEVFIGSFQLDLPAPGQLHALEAGVMAAAVAWWDAALGVAGQIAQEAPASWLRALDEASAAGDDRLRQDARAVASLAARWAESSAPQDYVAGMGALIQLVEDFRRG